MSIPASESPVVMEGNALEKSFGAQIILDKADFRMHEGEVILLRGPNGSGKTTLLNMLTGNLAPESGHLRIHGDHGNEGFHFPQNFLATANPFDHFSPEGIARQGLSRTWQDIRLFPSHTLRDNVVLAIKNQIGERFISALFKRGKVGNEQRKLDLEASEMLARFGLAGRENSSADMVSLGQSKRVAIARCVHAGARIIFLDEPLAALDSKGIDDVIAFLRSLVKEHRITLVVVEHVFNIPRILDLATTVWTLRDGKIDVEDPEVIRAEAEEASRENIGPWLHNLARMADPEVVNLPGGATLTLVRLADRTDEPPALELRDLVVRRGKRAVIGTTDENGKVSGVNFRIPRGHIALLQAPNGWGKTTLVDALTGVIQSSNGQIMMNGNQIQGLPVWDRVQKGMGVMQSRNNTFPNLTVDESLKLAGITTPPETVRPFMGRGISQLSGGQRQKVAAACALAGSQGKTLILDEPFSMLDMAAISEIQAGIIANTDGATLILLPAASQH